MKQYEGTSSGASASLSPKIFFVLLCFVYLKKVRTPLFHDQTYGKQMSVDLSYNCRMGHAYNTIRVVPYSINSIFT